MPPKKIKEEELMKKALFIMLALVVIAGFVYADGITFGAWGRAIFVPAMNKGADTMAMNMVSWGPGGNRISFTISGTSANVGVQADVLVDNNAVSCGDQQKIWIKPISMLTIQAGRIYDDTLRGSASYGAWNWLRFGGMNGDGQIYARVGEYGETAFEVSVAPADGLYIYAGLGGNGINLLASSAKSITTFQAGQYGAGYTIPGIGVIRAQWIGIKATGDEVSGEINGAFKLTAVSGLTADIGVYYPIDNKVRAYMAKIPVYVQYSMDPVTINASGTVYLPKKDDMLSFEAGLGANATVDKTNNIGVEADVRFQSTYYANLTNGAFGVLLDVTKGFSNGMCGIGVEITTGSFATNWGTENLPSSGPDALAWAIPIRLEYWF
jgi:hypothetical protein